MATTRLGWDVLSSNSDQLVSLPWITGKVRKGDAYTILNELGRRFNSDVEKIKKDESWGYAARNVRGASVISEHAAGTAVDFNAPDHWLGLKGTFEPKEVLAIRRILKDLGGSVRWGGDYYGRKDEMHFELQGGTKKLKEVADKIKGGSLPQTKPQVPSKPTSGKAWPQALLASTNSHTTASHNAWVKLMADVTYKDKKLGLALQKWLKDLGYYSGRLDGNFASMSVKALQSFLKKKGFYKGKIDGDRGSMTIKAEIAYLNDQAKYY